MLVRFEDHLGVRRRVESLPERRELAAQLLEVVDLAVERDHATGCAVDHRLRAGLAQVEDREPAVRKHDVVRLRDPEPGAVGPTVAKRAADPIDAPHDVVAIRQVRGGIREVAHSAGNSTHLLFAPTVSAATLGLASWSSL